jgi:hydrogenase maturation protease
LAAKRNAVIGIGNVLMADDGAGVRVLDLLLPLPKNVAIIELATGGMSLLHKLEGLDTAIIVDAVDFGGKPGEVRVFRPEEVKSIKTVGYSLHDLDILKVLELAKQMGTLPKRVFIAAIQPASLEMDEGLSPEVEKALPELARKILSLLVNWD